MYPQECFAYYKRSFWPVLCLKRIGLPFYILIATIVTCSLQIILLSNYSLLTVSALADITLLKTTCHFLPLLVGFDTLTYRKNYDRSPILVGHQSYFLALLLGSEIPLVRKQLYSVLKFIVTCYYGKQSFEGFVRGISTSSRTTISYPSTYCTY